MDPVINSLVQSPFVRSMSTVPSKATSFVHGVRDNVPPFSYQKVVVQPWNNISQTTQDQSHKFRIPQFGTLNRAYLRIKTVNHQPSNLGPDGDDYDTDLFNPEVAGASIGSDAAFDYLKSKTRLPWTHGSQMKDVPDKTKPLGGGGTAEVAPSSIVNPTNGALLSGATLTNQIHFPTTISVMNPENKMGKASSAWNVVNVLDEIRLTTNGKTIETLYGETIPAEVVKMPEQLRDFYIKGMVGWACGDDVGAALAEPNYLQPWDPSASHRDLYGRLAQLTYGGPQVQLLRNQHANFICPVPLSSLKTLSKNYQTRFVEDLELEVKMKELARGFNEYTNGNTEATLKYHQVELVLIYHNWHDNIENTIRNSNYKRGVPASVYSTNWVRAASNKKAVSESGALSIPLSSRNLVTEIVIVGRSLGIGSTLGSGGFDSLRRRKSDYVMLMDRQFHYDVEFKGSGKTIWSGKSVELQGPDTSDYDLTDRKMMGGDAGYGAPVNKRSSYDHHGVDGGTQITSATPSYNISKSTAYTHGGVDFSFGDNMAILRFGFQTTDEFYSGGIALQTISNPTLVLTPHAGATWLDKEIEFDVYVKHSNLVRIDSDTGAITRTLDV